MTFTTQWLDLREPADAVARNADILGAFALAVGQADTPRILDLGGGTGSSLRTIAPHLPLQAHWTVADRDRALLQAARTRHPEIDTMEVDLTGIDVVPIPTGGFVTASALIDLCSHAWMQRLLIRLRREGAAFYAALSYDGTMTWSVAHPLDAEVTVAFNHHQQGDKGFGPALGASAGGTLLRVADDMGFQVLSGPSPWRLGEGQAALQRDLLRGIADAVAETGRVEGVADWLDFRLAQVDGPCLALIGHLDVLAIPHPA
ncbi:class I SAM-dependent methyltransferase [Falsirhodobacter halotolerans]|uniref:class I SAM-dependent methyltransferase n=1 Tax=Falsirhodobacter halotolerans TaxID=1146892 RepID=UPI001FD0CA94|nr:class I SAM-dependent methyltransferase [Falsirhodobacter halotolerans]MCJ8139986.1 class I SAM-dependent methyltransferase [Falsirhodobacter halotolerans]